jgi:DNA-binding response OmpR family regulator
VGSRILVIEDNPSNVALMTYLLNAFGHTTIVARDGEEGVAVALRTNPDLVLCDLALPKLDGRGVALRLKSESSLAGVPLIAVTAAEPFGAIVGTGFDGYIYKPISPETFVAEVERHLRRPSEQDVRVAR